MCKNEHVLLDPHVSHIFFRQTDNNEKYICHNEQFLNLPYSFRVWFYFHCTSWQVWGFEIQLHLKLIGISQWRIHIVKFWTRPPFFSPNFFIFMQFSANFGQIIGWHLPFGLTIPLWEILDPPLFRKIFIFWWSHKQAVDAFSCDDFFIFCHKYDWFKCVEIVYNSG